MKENIELKKSIIFQLKTIKYNFSYIGTEYLVDVIYNIYITQKVSGYNLEKDVYPLISKKYNTTVKNIKNNILNATDKMYYDCEEKILEEYVGYTSKPTPKKIIKCILQKIELLI